MTHWRIVAAGALELAAANVVKRKLEQIHRLGLPHVRRTYRIGRVLVLATLDNGVGTIVVRSRDDLAVWDLSESGTPAVVSVFDPDTGVETRTTTLQSRSGLTKSGKELGSSTTTVETWLSSTLLTRAVTAAAFRIGDATVHPGGRRRIYEQRRVFSWSQQGGVGDYSESKDGISIAIHVQIPGQNSIPSPNGEGQFRTSAVTFLSWNDPGAGLKRAELKIGGVTVASPSLAQSTLLSISSVVGRLLHPGAGWTQIDSGSTPALSGRYALLPQEVVLLATFEDSPTGSTGRTQRLVARWYNYLGALVGQRSFDANIVDGLSGAPISVDYDGVGMHVGGNFFGNAGGAEEVIHAHWDLSSFSSATQSLSGVFPGVSWQESGAFDFTGGSGSLVGGARIDGYRTKVDSGSVHALGFIGGVAATISSGDDTFESFAAAIVEWEGQSYVLLGTGFSGTQTGAVALSSTGALSSLAVTSPLQVTHSFAKDGTTLVVRLFGSVFLSVSSAGGVQVLCNHSAAARTVIWCASPLGAFVLTEAGLFLNGQLQFSAPMVNSAINTLSQLLDIFGQPNVIIQHISGADIGTAVLQVGFRTGSHGVWEISHSDGVWAERKIYAAADVTSSAAGADSMLFHDRRFIGGFDFSGRAWK